MSAPAVNDSPRAAAGQPSNDHDSTSTQVDMIPVRLVTKSIRYSIPNAKYMIPSAWRRFQLSELINKVLENSRPTPFDFVINDQLLRSSIKDFMNAKGLSTENVLEIEYIESVLPPKYLESFPHDDWVSSLSISKTGIFMTTCYDSNLRLFSPKDATKPLRTLVGHQQPVLSACWIPELKINSSSSDYIASGGMDRVIRIWQLSPDIQDQELLGASPSALTMYVLPLHKSPVSTIMASQHSLHLGQLVTGDWQGCLALWDLSKSEGDQRIDIVAAENEEILAGEPQPKRRKKGRGVAAEGLVTSKQPIQVINGHQSKISRAQFALSDPQKVVTASHDHTVKRFDLETGIADWSKTSGNEKCIMDMDECRGREGLLVTACMDRTVCFWDIREESQNVSLTLHGHNGPVSSISSNPSSSNSLQILSGSYDGTCKIWDTRSTKQSLYTIVNPLAKDQAIRTRQSGHIHQHHKILSVGWNLDGNLIGAGGEDRQLCIHSVNN